MAAEDVAVVEISNCPKRFDSFQHKADELRLVYKFLIDLSNQLKCYEIYFIDKRPTVH
jgi:hypothetical protein